MLYDKTCDKNQVIQCKQQTEIIQKQQNNILTTTTSQTAHWITNQYSFRSPYADLFTSFFIDML